MAKENAAIENYEPTQVEDTKHDPIIEKIDLILVKIAHKKSNKKLDSVLTKIKNKKNSI